MKFLILSLMLILFLSACTGVDKNLPYQEQDLRETSKALQESISDYGNGIFLYEDEDGSSLVVINGSVVDQSAKMAPYYENIVFEVREDTLWISFTEHFEKNYLHKELTNQLIYRINRNEFKESYDTIKVLKNDKEIPITGVIIGEF
ncbi:hypothetical protein ACQKFO_05820 [Rossellomorea sp. NPDC071047]|uniref:hypothetical protein n=1 Tax=Rossellomorea sp. NPDC071047 TaxID=3390675 RepID=UPI003CFC86B0